MGMKMRGAVLASVVLLGTGIAVGVPSVAREAVPQAKAVRVTVEPYRETVVCSGVIEMPQLYQVTRSTPLVPQEVCVQEGDRVRQGDCLLVVDRQATLTVNEGSAPSSAGNGQEASVEAVLSQLPESYREIARSMGLADQLADSQPEKTETSAASLSVPQQLLSPIDGVVLEAKAQAGTASSANGVLFTIGDTSRYIAKVTVGEEDIAKIQEGDEALVEGKGFEGRTYSGVVQSIAPVAQRQNGGAVVEVEILLLQPDEGIKSGFSAQVTILTGESQNLLLLPYEAVGQDAQNQEYVLVWRDGRLEKRAVETGRETADGVEILQGLAPGDVVVLSPQEYEDKKPVRLEA